MKKVVIKIGSSVIAPGGKLNSTLVSRIVKDIVSVEKKGYKVILVSSGAVACGLNKLGYKKRPKDIHSLMAFSSLGQILLMDLYAGKFKQYKRSCAQILLTWDDFDNRKRFLNARVTINKLLQLGMIPIINENDVVSFEEIRFGDNDRLSALVADLMEAEKLILLSDVDGLMRDNEMIHTVDKIDASIFALARKDKPNLTSGGMATKLEAAQIACSAGRIAVIANGNTNGVIPQIVLGKGKIPGTMFCPDQKEKKARKRWIAFSKKIKGKVYIDDGAKEAILYKGRSLLGVGIIKIEGEFKKKDAVQIVDKNGVACGSGLVDYSSEELANFKEKRFAKPVVHRDNFVKVFEQNF